MENSFRNIMVHERFVNKNSGKNEWYERFTNQNQERLFNRPKHLEVLCLAVFLYVLPQNFYLGDPIFQFVCWYFLCGPMSLIILLVSWNWLNDFWKHNKINFNTPFFPYIYTIADVPTTVCITEVAGTNRQTHRQTFWKLFLLLYSTQPFMCI